MAGKTFHVVKMHFTAPLHLSTGRGDYDESQETLHSDMVISALAVCGLELWGADWDVKGFLDSFRISSGMLFSGNTCFFPKHLARVPLFSDIEPERQGKPIKKLRWYSKTYFEQILKGSTAPISMEHIFGKGIAVAAPEDHGAELTADQIFFSHESQQRVYIPSETEVESEGEAMQTRPYRVDRIRFSKDAGLYFLLDASEESVSAEILPCFRLLGDHGIGTDRSAGNGQFEVSTDTITIDVPAAATHYITLSLYCPEEKEFKTQMEGETASYQLIRRGGWIASPENVEHSTLRKRSVYMFLEGSVFPSDHPLAGKCVDLKPAFSEFGHPVFRDGRPVSLPIIPAL